MDKIFYFLGGIMTVLAFGAWTEDYLQERKTKKEDELRNRPKDQKEN